MLDSHSFDLAAECKRAAKIIREFVHPDPSGDGPDKVIPVDIIANAKGLAILTVVKAGFIWSGKLGSGVVVAKLPDGTFSAPSAIGTGGMGFGGQIGAQLTDFVIILNNLDAVKAFSQGGNVTLGGSLSVAAGPVGRTAEAGGAIGGLAPIYSYSKSKGLFAGVSIEGAVIIERKDANAEFYKRRISAKEILSGSVPKPQEASELYNELDARIEEAGRQQLSPKAQDGFPPIPSRPTEKSSSSDTVRAMYDYKAQNPGDLSFKAGDIITVVRRTGNQNDWWTGTVNGQTGLFPANYVK